MRRSWANTEGFSRRLNTQNSLLIQLRKTAPLRLLKHRPEKAKNSSRLLQLTFQSQERVPASGVYRVAHGEHRLPSEVTLLQGNRFPRCSACAADVRFRFLRAVEVDPEFQVDLYNLPVIGDGKEDTLQESGAA